MSDHGAKAIHLLIKVLRTCSKSKGYKNSFPCSMSLKFICLINIKIPTTNSIFMSSTKGEEGHNVFGPDPFGVSISVGSGILLPCLQEISCTAVLILFQLGGKFYWHMLKSCVGFSLPDIFSRSGPVGRTSGFHENKTSNIYLQHTVHAQWRWAAETGDFCDRIKMWTPYFLNDLRSGYDS